ncbi:hypothetical protein PR202_ga20181 [Eleusine coracana subsp. coracana]|uniref:Uncharacterized protein n=1 Tax=Eleusine coracana subsp. coracana TaxID=191504 RepID=A0AAV5CX24_ELECO|nr:hypothetical protein PR202_ga20181 [Eleusine coracana subsp. coracana]
MASPKGRSSICHARIPDFPVGPTGQPMPAVGLGTASHPFVAEDVRAGVLSALEIGYRHIDTAALYASERVVGEAMAEAVQHGIVASREELFVTSKVWCTQCHPELVLPSLRESLLNLQLEYVDLYLVHWPMAVKPSKPQFPMRREDIVPMDLHGVWQAMEECHRLGLAKMIGVSNFITKKLQELLAIAKIPPSINQVELNPSWQQKKLIEFCKNKGIHVAAYSPLGGQRITDMNPVRHSDVLEEIAKARGKSVAQPCGPPVGVGNPDPRCTCIAYAVNLISGRCGNGQLAVLPFSANATNGGRPLFPVSFNAYQTCAPNEFVLESLPSGAVGMAGLSRQLLSLPNQVASKLKVTKQFALCLPSGSSSQPGAAIFGGGPFVLQSQKPEDLTQSLVGSLPLVKNPKNSAYYFRVHGIAVNQKAVALPAGVLDLDPHTGRGGVVFSTLTQYTTLRDDIYGKVLEAFEKATSGVEWVKPPPPFFRCFPESAFSPTRLGPGVANIDLMLENGRNWTLPGASSLVPVAGRLCFAFQSMGSPASQAPDAPAIIFGTHQMQDNLVQFDLEKNTFGFSGLLLGRSTNCGNFNFKSSILTVCCCRVSTGNKSYPNLGPTDLSTSGIPCRPHNLCFDASAFSSSQLGAGVANIDFMLHNGLEHGTPTSEAPDAPAVIFGTHQMQDNLVQFDLAQNTFSFSGLLAGRCTQCGNFNFNMGSS